MIIHTPEELALVLKSYRKSRKLSQTEVAEKVGVRQTTVSAFENKPGSTQIETLFSLLNAANADLYIFPKGVDLSKETWKEEW